MSILLIHLDPVDIEKVFVDPYVLSGFFFVSGYTFTERLTAKEFFIKKIKTLVVPVLCFGIINMLLSVVARNIDWKSRLIGIFAQFPGHGDDMWFVACLFIMQIQLFYILKLTNRRVTQFVVCIAFSALGLLWANFIRIPLPWHIVNACVFLPMLFGGYAYRLLDREIRKANRGKPIIKSYGWHAIIWGVLYFTSIYGYKNLPFDAHLLIYGNISAFMFNLITGTGFIVSFCRWIERWNSNIGVRFLVFIGVNSLAYYGMQSKIISIMYMIARKFGLFSDWGIWALVLMLVASVLLAPIAIIVNKYFPFLLGKAYKKS